MFLDDLPGWFLITNAIALGLVFGSFLNVVIYRLPRGENLAYPGSRCPGCGTPIRAWNNLPILSWLLLRGKASCCGAPISPRYPLVEAIGGLVGWAVLEMIVLPLGPGTPLWHGGLLFALYLTLGLGLIAATFIDLEYMIVPDEITVGGAALGLLSAPLRIPVERLPTSFSGALTAQLGQTGAAWVEALVGAGLGFLIVWLPFDLLYRAIRGRTGMAVGDAKLVMLAGAWFGWGGALFALCAGAVQGTLVAIAVFAAHGKIDEPEAVQRERAEARRAIEAAEGEEKRALEAELAADPLADEPEEGLMKARLPFGPFLALATIELMLFGELILEAYLSYVWA